MHTSIPSAEQVRATLAPFTQGQLAELAALSSVPFTTLIKVRNGQTANPRLETVRQFMPHVAAVAAGAPEVATQAGA